jgi:hypothetical protein
LSAFANSPKARQCAVREVDGDVGEKDAAWGAGQTDARQVRQIALAAMFVLAGGVGQQRDNEWKCAPLSSEPRANNRPLASSFAKASRDPNNANSRKEYIMPAFTKVGLDALLTPENCAVLLIDHQPSQLANVNSHEPTMVINNLTALAKTARAVEKQAAGAGEDA